MIDLLEEWARQWQLKIMNPAKGMERIEDGGLYFHPFDVRDKILKEYKRRISKLAK